MNDSALVDHRITQVESAVLEIRGSLKGINESLVTLTRLEVHHAETRDGLKRAHERVDELDDRVAEIELSLPVLKLTSHWVKAGVIGVVTLVLIALGKMVIGT